MKWDQPYQMGDPTRLQGGEESGPVFLETVGPAAMPRLLGAKMEQPHPGISRTPCSLSCWPRPTWRLMGLGSSPFSCFHPTPGEPRSGGRPDRGLQWDLHGPSRGAGTFCRWGSWGKARPRLRGCPALRIVQTEVRCPSFPGKF